MISINTIPNAGDLMYFRTICETQNLSRAAERLGIGQPALSLSLKRLEEGLGVPLMIRRARGLLPTPAGEALLKSSRVLLQEWEKLAQNVSQIQNEPSGKFVIGAHPSVAIYAGAPLVKKIVNDYPKIEIDLRHGLSREVLEEVISGKVDFGLVVNAAHHPDLVIRTLCKDEVCFWQTTRGNADVLIAHPGLSQTHSLLSRKELKGRFLRTIYSENLEVIAALARSGVGVALLPTRVVQSQAPDLVALSGLPTFQDQLSFIYRSDLPKTGGARAILECTKSLKI